MSHRRTIELEQQGNHETEVPADLPQTTQRGLIALRPAQLVSTTSPGLLANAPTRSLTAHTTQHTRCRCPRCRKRRARKRAARMNPQNAPIIEATIINVTPWVDERPGGQEYTPTSSGIGTHSQPSWSAQQPLPGSRRRRFSPWQVCMAIAVLLALAWISGLGDPLFAYLFPSPAATITIIPASSRENFAVTVTAVTGQPDVTQVAARTLQGTSPTRTVMARATGSGQTPAIPASGKLTFFNEGSSPQTLGAGLILTGADGIQVVTDSAVTIAAGNPPAVGSAWVYAHTVQGGSQANIAAGDVNGLCCGPGLAVKSSSFSGGQDGQTYPILEQHDIDAATATVTQALIQQAQRQVVEQVSGAEQPAVDSQCHTSIAAASPAGSHVAQASISVSATCTGETFERAAVLRLAASLFAQGVAKQLGPAYAPSSRITTKIVQASLTDARSGALTVLVRGQGTWSYQFSRAKQQTIARRIQGRSVSVALSLLAQVPGVAHTSLSLSGGAQQIPSDPARITIVILPVPGEPSS
jgi:hypothetical protein